MTILSHHPGFNEESKESRTTTRHGKSEISSRSIVFIRIRNCKNLIISSATK